MDDSSPAFISAVLSFTCLEDENIDFSERMILNRIRGRNKRMMYAITRCMLNMRMNAPTSVSDEINRSSGQW